MDVYLDKKAVLYPTVVCISAVVLPDLPFCDRTQHLSELSFAYLLMQTTVIQQTVIFHGVPCTVVSKGGHIHCRSSHTTNYSSFRKPCHVEFFLPRSITNIIY
jgi:hypothetical protein